MKHSFLSCVLPGSLENTVELSKVTSNFDEVEMISIGNGVVLIQICELGVLVISTSCYSVHERLQVRDGGIHAIPSKEETKCASKRRRVVDA